MRGFSKAIIVGNLTRDPEVRTTPSGTMVCSFAVAVNRVYRDTSGGQREDVSFIDCTAWGKLAEMIGQYAKKGSGVLVSGRLDQRSFEGKDGVKRSRTEIVVEDFNFVGSPNRDGASSSYTGGSSAADSLGAPATSDASADSVIPTDIPDGEINLSEVPF
ncbi:single-stranded DNA-binding protein [Candidatus Saccharibacteria bacterium]|nr:single-stranded DNA-binding protein [Candidatus Saccharibacteria bacterium]